MGRWEIRKNKVHPISAILLDPDSFNAIQPNYATMYISHRFQERSIHGPHLIISVRCVDKSAEICFICYALGRSQQQMDHFT